MNVTLYRDRGKRHYTVGLGDQQDAQSTAGSGPVGDGSAR